jgi:predicted AlkP superfamily phosphohydrolase/phosphomutase
MTTNRRTVIIGLDGVPFGMLKELAQSGVMPNTALLIKDGIFKKMNSSIPEISSVAWSSIITGANPGTHGIFGFMDLHGGSYKMRFPNFNDLKVAPFWEQWPGKSVIINVPSTYPVRPMNGVHISGFVSIDLEKSVYPQSLTAELKRQDYRLDVDSELAHRDINLFIKDLDDSHFALVRVAKMLLKYSDWQTFMVVFTGTDRLMHFLFDAYDQSNHKYHQFFLDYFANVDRAIGDVMAHLKDDDLVVMLSDHGFERLDCDVFVNYPLIQKGLLQFKSGEEAALANICYGTKAFALEPARIYLNYKGRYPCGTVDPAEAEQLLTDIENLFGSLRVEGRKVIRSIYRKKQLYCGPCLDYAPDLVLVGNSGFNLRANLKTGELTAKPVFTGKHTQDTAFLLVRGLLDRGAIPDVPDVAAVRGIMEKGKSRA